MLSKDVVIGAVLHQAALDITQYQPGDIGIAHSKGIMGKLIRLGTHSHWNHAFVIVSVPELHATPETVMVIQAEAHGVELTTLDKVAPGGTYAVVAPPEGVNRALVVSMAHLLLRQKYAFISIVSLAVQILVPFIHLDFRGSSTIICSAVVALCLASGGWQKLWPDLYQVTPSEIAVALAAPVSMVAPG